MSQIGMQENKGQDDGNHDRYLHAKELERKANIFHQLKALGLRTDPELLSELAGGAFPYQKLLRDERPVELKPAGDFPSLRFEQAMAHKNIQKQLGFGKGCESQKAYKTKIEGMDAVYRGGLQGGRMNGVGEAVTLE